MHNASGIRAVVEIKYQRVSLYGNCLNLAVLSKKSLVFIQQARHVDRISGHTLIATPGCIGMKVVMVADISASFRRCEYASTFPTKSLTIRFPSGLSVARV